MSKKITMFLILLPLLLIILLATSCVSTYSQYLLTVEYNNPNSEAIERINIPVSQYSYENRDVGENYEVTIKTVILGIRVPVTDQGSSSNLALLDTMSTVFPLMLLLGAILYPILNKRKGFLDFAIPIIIAIGASVFLISTTAPDFSTVGTIVDKTFQIVSR